MTSGGIDVFGLGKCALDHIGLLDHDPEPDMKHEVLGLTIQGGGPVATALVALARWGCSCFFSGVIGDDGFGCRIRESLDSEGVDTGGLVVREGCMSQFAFIAAEPEKARRTIFWQRPTGAPPRIGEVDLARLLSARIFHTDGLFIETAIAAAREARKAGVPVSVDAGTLHEGMLELAGLADYFITAETFAQELTGGDGPQEACRRLAAMGPRVVGVTLGARGYVALTSGRFIERPAYPVQAVDTTGCGDVFHAGFIYGCLKRWTVERSLDFGAWSASRVSLYPGGRTGIPMPADLERNGYGS